MSTPEEEARIAAPPLPKRGSAAMVRGHGCWIEDSRGHRYLDLTSGHGIAPLGHSHPALVEAIQTQSERLISLSNSFFNDTRADFLARLKHVLPNHFDRIFLCNSGTEAVEAGLKFAFSTTRRTGVVALRRGFHGRTLGSLATTWNPKFRNPFSPLLNEVSFVAPDSGSDLEGAIDEETGLFVAEIIQGEGGVFPVDEELLRHAQDLCRQRGALFMVDEVQTGFGRTGDFLAHVPLGLEPDLMALAKGIAGGFPMGALALSPSVAESLAPAIHGTTFGGGPLACSAGLATLETLERDGLVGNARRMGDLLMDGLERSLGEHDVVREIRGRGLMVGIGLRKKVAPYLARLMEEHSILTLPAGPTVLRLLPPLVVNEGEIESAVEAISAVLSG